MPYNKVINPQIKLEVLNMIAKQIEKQFDTYFFL
jgi:hypothetical protein